MSLRVAVVGSGPAGFYAAGHLLDVGLPVEVDMIERLPTPWGLVRLGVAPDHPKIKAVSKAFEKIAAQPGFRFLGNVEVGRDLTARGSRPPLRRGRLRGRRPDRPPHGHPRRGPARLLARHRVRRLVQRPPRLPGALVRPLRRARGCGRGRQRRDRRRADARARARGDPADRHDRRGDRRDPRLRLEGDRPAGPPRPGPGGIHDARAEGARRAGRRRRDRRPRRPRARPCERGLARARTRTRGGTSRCCASTRPARRPGGRRRSVCGSASRPLRSSARTASRRSRSYATASSPTRPAVSRAEPTGEHETIPCGIVFRSVGYQGVELPGVPFDGRPDPERVRPGRAAGVYCAGWIKRGPSGVIGTNKKDATETVELLLEDARGGEAPSRRSDRDRGNRRRAAGRARRRGT